MRIALTSGLTRKQVADDLGVGMSTLNKWITAHRDTDLVRMTEELKEIGLNVGHRRVGRLMRQNGISVVRTRKHKATTDSYHKFNIAPNLLDRNFAADKPNQKWAGDISYVWTREGWLYLAVILDLHSRRVIGWAVSNRMKRDLAIRALNMAIAFRQPPKGCIHHTDRGSQYCSHDYQKILRQNGCKVSMSGKGNCYGTLIRQSGAQRLIAIALLLNQTLESRTAYLRFGCYPSLKDRFPRSTSVARASILELQNC